MALWSDSREAYLDHLRKSHTSIYFCIGEISQILELSDQRILSRCITDLFNAFNELFESNNNFLESKLKYFKKLEEREQDILKLDYQMKHSFLRKNTISYDNEISARSNTLQFSSKDITKLQFEALQLKEEERKRREVTKAKEDATKKFMMNGMNNLDNKDFGLMGDEEAESLKREEERVMKYKVRKCMEAMDDYKQSNYLDLMFEPQVIIEVSKQVYKKLIDQSQKNVENLSKTVDRLNECGKIEPTASKALDILVEEIKTNTPELEYVENSKDSIFLKKKYVDEILRSTEDSLKDCFQRNNEKIAYKAIKAYINVTEERKRNFGTQTDPNKQLTTLKSKVSKLKKDLAERDKNHRIIFERENQRYSDLTIKHDLELKIKNEYVEDLNHKIIKIERDVTSKELLIEKLKEDVAKLKGEKSNMTEILKKNDSDLGFLNDYSQKLNNLTSSIAINLKDIVIEEEKKIQNNEITLNFDGVLNLSDNLEKIWRFLSKLSKGEFEDKGDIPNFNNLLEKRKKLKTLKPTFTPKLIEIPDMSRKGSQKKKNKIKKKKEEEALKNEKMNTINLSIYSDQDQFIETNERFHKLNTSIGHANQRGSITGLEMNKTMSKINNKSIKNLNNGKINIKKRHTVGPSNILNSRKLAKIHSKVYGNNKNDLNDTEKILPDKENESQTKSISSNTITNSSPEKFNLEKNNNNKIEINDDNRKKELTSINEDNENQRKKVEEKLKNLSKEKLALKGIEEKKLIEENEEEYNESGSENDKTLILNKKQHEEENSENDLILVRTMDKGNQMFNKRVQTEEADVLIRISGDNNTRNITSHDFDKEPFRIPTRFLISDENFKKNDKKKKEKKNKEESFYEEKEEIEALRVLDDVVSALKMDKKSKKMLKEILKFVIEGDENVKEKKKELKNFREKNLINEDSSPSIGYKIGNSERRINDDSKISNSLRLEDPLLNNSHASTEKNKQKEEFTYRNKYKMKGKNQSMNEYELSRLKNLREEKLPNLMSKGKISTEYNKSERKKWRYKSFDEELDSKSISKSQKNLYYVQNGNNKNENEKNSGRENVNYVNDISNRKMNFNYGGVNLKVIEERSPLGGLNRDNSDQKKGNLVLLLEADNPQKRIQFLLNTLEDNFKELSTFSQNQSKFFFVNNFFNRK